VETGQCDLPIDRRATPDAQRVRPLIGRASGKVSSRRRNEASVGWDRDATWDAAAHPRFERTTALGNSSDPSATAGSRHAVIDWLRVAAIIAVVCHHSGPHAMSSPIERFVRDTLTDFDVPVFLFASGFLYFAPTPVRLRELGRRFERVLIPYVLASALVWTVGLKPQSGLADMAFGLATGSALGIYYYVFLITISIPLVWPLSRMTKTQIAVLALAAHLYPMIAKLVPAIAIDLGLFGRLRNPLLYSWAYFLTGWLVAAHLPELRRLRDRRPMLLFIAGLAGIALWMINGDRWLGVPWITNGRAVYSLSVVLVASVALAGRSVPQRVLFVSQASYTIYLYHLFVVAPLRWRWADWDWWISVPLITAIGVCSPLALAYVARRVLGDRARTWFG
jgi:peptidoglycan/LPS O-acetylase OafA/YrhL